MAREYHVVAVGGRNENEVSVDLGDILNTLGAQDWELNVAVPLQDSDTLLLILSRAKPSARKRLQVGLQTAPAWLGGLSPIHPDRRRLSPARESRERDSNPRPSDYKSEALPAELSRRSPEPTAGSSSRPDPGVARQREARTLEVAGRRGGGGMRRPATGGRRSGMGVRRRSLLPQGCYSTRRRVSNRR